MMNFAFKMMDFAFKMQELTTLLVSGDDCLLPRSQCMQAIVHYMQRVSLRWEGLEQRLEHIMNR